MALLAACTPRFDWRDYRGPEGFVATFPARVQSADRSIDLDGLTVRMTMHAAQVGEIDFVVASVAVPGADAKRLVQVQDAIARGLVQNLSGRIDLDHAVRLNDPQGSGAGTAARALSVSGTANGQAMRMEAQIAARADHVFQILVVAPEHALDGPAAREALDTFFTSVRLD